MVTVWTSVNWPAPERVKAVYTTRQGGCSLPPYDSFNLGLHVADDPQRVLANRAFLKQSAGLPVEPCWLNQVHGTQVYQMTGPYPDFPPDADAAVTRKANLPLAILTADCLPILLCDKQGTWVAAVHAGWRGLAAGVIEQTLADYNGTPTELMAWLGPAIGPRVFEVGGEVRQAFLATDQNADKAFRAGSGNKFFANLPMLASQRLQASGVTDITDSGLCTFSDSLNFYSYRRDGQTGRMAAVIWLTAGL